MSCSNNTKPIDGSSAPIQLTVVPQDLATMLGVALPTAAKRAVIHFDLAPAGKTDPLGRMSRDINFVPTASVGEPIWQGKPKVLTLEQFDTPFRSVTGTIDAFVEFFETEV
jgi:hypothetical protein